MAWYRFSGVVCLAALAVVVTPGRALAAASLSGQVTDATGAPLPGARVTATRVETSVSYPAVTNREGVYVVSSLPSGRYRVTVELSGFKTIVKPDVDIHVQDNVALNFAMEVGSVIESVTVEGGAPLVSMDPAVGTLVNRSFVENLPLNGRSFQSLIAVTPGVVLTRTTSEEQGQFSVNGQRADANYFMVDGVSANIGVTAGTILGQGGGGALPGLTAFGGTNNLVSIDALEEFRIETSTYAPEFGRTSGAQISLVTRAGTNQLHGAGFDYIRNDALDANDWFANSRGLPKPALRQQNFGGVLGGPAIRNRLFYFLSYEGLNLRRPQVTIVSVPTLAARAAGIPAVRPALAAFPQPNGRELGNGLAEFAASYSNPSTLSATSLRMDFAQSSGVRYFGRINVAPSHDEQRVLSLNSIKLFDTQTTTATGGASLLLGSKTTVDVHANVSSNSTRSDIAVDDFGGAQPPPLNLFFPPSAPLDDSGYTLALLDSGVMIQYGRQADNTQHQINVVGTVSRLMGSHLLKGGVDYRRLFPSFSAHQYGSAPIFSNLAQMQAGTTALLFIIAETGERHPIFDNFSAYAQDTWTVNPRLTLTYGVRWDYNPPPTEANGRNPILADTSVPAATHLLPPDTPIFEASTANFAPRVGASFRLIDAPGHETVVRGGYGLFYDLNIGRAADVFTYGTYPYQTRRLLFNVPFPPTPADLEPAPFDRVNPKDVAVFSFPAHLYTPHTRQWNVAVERAIGRSNSVSASYIGGAGRRLLRLSTLIAPTPQFDQVFVTSNDGMSNYRALQLQFKRRLSRGLEGLATYTWARSLDNSSADSYLSSTPGALDGAHVDFGPSDFDVRHAATGAITWNIPSASTGFLSPIVRNWALDGLFTARTATPFTPRVLTTSVQYRTPIRPDVVPGVPWYLDIPAAPGGRVVNAAAFVAPPPGRQGNLQRNIVRGFPLFQIDLAIRRTLSLTDRTRLSLKLEAFNVLNHPNFANPATTLITSPTFGISQSMLAQGLGGGGTFGGFSPLYQTGGPRSMQLSLRVSF
jgi:hypothetical protein